LYGPFYNCIGVKVPVDIGRMSRSWSCHIVFLRKKQKEQHMVDSHFAKQNLRGKGKGEETLELVLNKTTA